MKIYVSFNISGNTLINQIFFANHTFSAEVAFIGNTFIYSNK